MLIKASVSPDVSMEADWKVRGRVQGVSLRAWCEQEARALKLSGWVRNEPDGILRLHLSGPEAAIEKMKAALLALHRPGGADVERIEEVGGSQTGNPPGTSDNEFVVLD